MTSSPPPRPSLLLLALFHLLSLSQAGATRPALLVIDVQNDFISGSLAVAGAEDIVQPISDLAKDDIWAKVVFSQDWHPTDHISFFSNLYLRDLDPAWREKHPGPIHMFDTVVFAGEPPYEQVLWPDHCVQGSAGADFHQGLEKPEGVAVIQKGVNPDVDSYSAFYDNSGNSGSGSTGLDRLLDDAAVTEVVVVGLATDFCVGSTALDALSLGLPTTLLHDLARPVSQEGGEEMLARVEEAGGAVMTLEEWRDGQRKKS